MTKWYTYVLKCGDDTLYTGSTTDLTRRSKEHNTGKGGNYTRTRLPVEIVYKEVYPTRSEAQKREAEIKKLSKTGKLDLISK